MMRVTLSELSRLPVERLAQLLMEWAIEDQRLLVRLHATLEENHTAPPQSTHTAATEATFGHHRSKCCDAASVGDDRPVRQNR